jgi:hypothetical protein
MDEKEIKTQAIIQALISQREGALNLAASLQGELAIVRKKLEELEKYKPTSEPVKCESKE